MAADQIGIRTENLRSEDGLRTDPASIRDSNWATLNWVAYHSFSPDSSSPPRTHTIAFPDSDRVCVDCPESENSERPVVEGRESPGVRKIERTRRIVSTRSELEVDEHPESVLREIRRTLRESERQETRRGLRKSVRVRSEKGRRGLPEFRRTLRKEERTRPERQTRHSRRRTESLPDAVAMALVGGAKIPEKRVLPAIPTHVGDFEELITDLKTIGCSGLFGRVWDVQDADMLAEIGGGAMEPAFRSSIRAKYGNWTREH
jgi:hypothetical protein